MDLVELRINRTQVPQNRKCEGCVHYDGNAQAKTGVCEVGSMPTACGTGGDPRYGYAPLSEMGPDEIDDLATPCINGPSGLIGDLTDGPGIEMKRVCLGDEDLTIAQRIYGETNIAKSITQSQGQVSQHSGLERIGVEKPKGLLYDVVKALRSQYFAPRKAKKFDDGAVLQFLVEKGMTATQADYDAAGISKALPSMQFKPNASGGHAHAQVATTSSHQYTIQPSEKNSSNSKEGPHQLHISPRAGGPTITQKHPSRAAAGNAAMTHANSNISKALPNVRKLG